MSDYIAYIKVHDNTNLARAIQEKLFEEFDESEINGWGWCGREFWEPTADKFDWLGITSKGVFKYAQDGNLSHADAPKFDVTDDWQEIIDHIRDSLSPNVPDIGGEFVSIEGPDSVRVGCQKFDRDTAEEILSILRGGYSGRALHYARKAVHRDVQTENVERVLELMDQYGEESEEEPKKDSFEVGDWVYVERNTSGSKAEVGEVRQIDKIDSSMSKTGYRLGELVTWHSADDLRPVEWIPATETEVEEGDIVRANNNVVTENWRGFIGQVVRDDGVYIHAKDSFGLAYEFNSDSTMRLSRRKWDVAR